MKRVLGIVGLLMLGACAADDGTTEGGDTFNREAMVTRWADAMIIPGYEAYSQSLSTLKSQGVSSFVQSPNAENLTALRNLWTDAYIKWQYVEMFEIGPAEVVQLQGFTNTFPVDTETLNDLVDAGEYNLELPSRRNQQGLPALDYLINGLGETDVDILNFYTSNDAAPYLQYMTDITDRLVALTDQVNSGWQNEYRTTFISANGSDANSAVNKLLNDFVFYYEKHLRASKVGIPAGVFSTSPSGAKVEAFYQGNLSKELFEEALSNTQNFFNGIGYDGSQDTQASIAGYLNLLHANQGLNDLTSIINAQFELARIATEPLNESFTEQVTINNEALLLAYDELQKNVVNMKVDMMSALNVRIDYVDADGD